MKKNIIFLLMVLLSSPVWAGNLYIYKNKDGEVLLDKPSITEQELSKTKNELKKRDSFNSRYGGELEALSQEDDDGIQKEIDEISRQTAVRQSNLDQLHKELINTWYVNADTLNVRNQPENGNIIDSLDRGQKVIVFETQGRWGNISNSNDKPYWVSLDLLCKQAYCWIQTDSRNTVSATKSTYSKSLTNKSTPYSSSCPCSGSSNCVGPRGGRYCITSGGNKRYR